MVWLEFCVVGHGSWLARIVSDLTFIFIKCQYADLIEALPQLVNALLEWVSFIESNPEVVSNCVDHVYQEDPWAKKPNEQLGEQVCQDIFQCIDCGTSFGPESALFIHQARVHGRRHAARSQISGSCCPGCLVLFGNRLRLLRHLDKARKCRKICVELLLSVASRGH